MAASDPPPSPQMVLIKKSRITLLGIVHLNTDDGVARGLRNHQRCMLNALTNEQLVDRILEQHMQY